MKKPVLRKILTSVLLAIVILIITALVLIHLFGGLALKVGIETAGTKALNVGVSLDDVSFSLLAGSIDMQDLVISNTAGYEHENLLELGRMHVKADIKSFLSDTVHIEEMKLDNIDLVIEQKGLSNNLHDVLNSIPSTPASEGDGGGKKLHIAVLEISNVKVKVKLLPLPGKADTIELRLPTIKMTDLGKDNMLDTGKLTTTILAKITAEIAKHGTNLPAEITDQFKAVLQKHGAKVLKAGKQALTETTKFGKDIVESGKDVGKDIEKSIKGIFGGKK